MAVVRAAAITSGSTQNFTFSGFGTPVGAIFQVSGGITDGTEGTLGSLSYGATDLTRTICISSSTKVAASGRERTWRRTGKQTSVGSTSDVICLLDNAGAITARFTYTATVTDGVQVTAQVLPGSAFEITCTLVGGADALMYVSDFAAPSVTGTPRVVTAPNFAGDFLILPHTGDAFSTTPSIVSGAMFGIGFATRRPSILNTCMFWGDTDNQITADPFHYLATTRCGISCTSSIITSRNFVSAFSSTGFSVQESDGNADGPPQGYILIKTGATISVGTVIETTPTSTGNNDHTLLGFAPQWTQTVDGFGTTNDAVDATDGASSNGLGMVGPAASATQSCVAIRERDGAIVSTPYAGGSMSDKKAVNILSGAGAAGIVATYSVWLQTGFRRNYITVQASGRGFAVLGVGQNTLTAAAAGATATSATLAGSGALSGTASGATGTSATLAATGALTGTAPGVTATSAAITLAGTSAGATAASGTLSATGALSGTSAGATTPSAVLAGTGSLVGSTSGATAASGVLSATGALTGATTGATAATGTLQATGALSGTSAGSTSASGVLSASGDLQGTSAGATATSATIGGTGSLQGTAAGNTDANLIGNGGISGDCTGSTACSGSLSAVGSLSGTSTGSTSAAAMVGGLGALAGSESASTSTSAVLQGLAPLSGSTAGSTVAAGTLVGVGNLVGSSAGATFAVAVLSATGALSATAAGATSTSALLEGSGDLAATAAGATAPSGTIGGIGDLAATSAGGTACSATFAAAGLVGTCAGHTSGVGQLSGIGNLVGSSAGHTACASILSVPSPGCPIDLPAGWNQRAVLAAGADLAADLGAGYDAVADLRASTC